MNAKLRKIFLGLSMVAVLGSLSGCGNDDEGDKKAHLTYGSYSVNKIKSITERKEWKYEDLVSKVAHEQSFILVLYNSTCSCWTELDPILTELMNTTTYVVEYMDVTQVMNQNEKYGLYTVKGDMPSVAIFNKGKLLDQQVYGINDPKTFRSLEAFKGYIESKCYAPKMVYIDKDTLASLDEANTDFTLYVARSECPDCQQVDEDLLKGWSDTVSETKNNLYIFDIQPYWASEKAGSTPEEVKAYNDLKDELKLTESTNPDLGFGTGSVPTFQRRKNGQILDMIVPLNDYVNKETKTLVSYFTEERVAKISFLKDATFTTVLQGMSLSDEQVEDWKNKKEAFYAEYHFPFVQLFLDTYVPKA